MIVVVVAVVVIGVKAAAAWWLKWRRQWQWQYHCGGHSGVDGSSSSVAVVKEVLGEAAVVV